MPFRLWLPLLAPSFRTHTFIKGLLGSFGPSIKEPIPRKHARFSAYWWSSLPHLSEALAAMDGRVFEYFPQSLVQRTEQRVEIKSAVS